MKKFIKFQIVILLLSCFFMNKLEAEEILSWEDCIKEAKKNHPDLIAGEEKLNQAKANKAITKSNLLPQISSDLSGKTSKTAASGKTDTYSYEVTGKQLLFDGFKTPYDIASAQENIKSSQYNYEVTSSNVRLRLRSAFGELLKAQELLVITEDIAKRRSQNVELVKLRYEAGREHKGAFLTAQANSAQALFEVTQAKRNIDLAQRRLNKELGRMQFGSIRVKGDFKIKYPYQEKPGFESLANSTPFLRELITRKEAARFDLKSAGADFFPQVYANASAGRTDSGWPPGKDKWSVGLSVSFPLFEGGSRVAEVSRAKAVFNQAEADARSGRDGVILTLEETWTDLQNAIDTVNVQQRFLEATQERAKIAQVQYYNGLITFDDWTIIEDESVKMKKSYLDAQLNALIAESYWIQAEGGTLDYEE